MRLHIPVGVRWSDLDAYGHVNNAAMFSLLEEARITAFWRGESDDRSGVPVTQIFEGGPNAETFTLIARQQAEYLAPIPHLREPLDVEMWIGHIGGASMDVCYEIYSPTGTDPRVLFARAVTTIVVIDAATQRPRKIRESERAVMEQIWDTPVSFRSP